MLNARRVNFLWDRMAVCRGGREGQEGWGWGGGVFVWMVFELNPGFNPTTLLLSGMPTHRLHTDNKSRTCEASCGFESGSIMIPPPPVCRQKSMTLEYTWQTQRDHFRENSCVITQAQCEGFVIWSEELFKFRICSSGFLHFRWNSPLFTIPCLKKTTKNKHLQTVLRSHVCYVIDLIPMIFKDLGKCVFIFSWSGRPAEACVRGGRGVWS